MKNKSVYIHIPFCKNICSYCDFCKLLYHEKWIQDYLNALEKEIITNYKHEKIRTLYIGGGTPSALNQNELKKLFEIISVFDLSSLEEFTFECNLNDINKEMLMLLKTNKVNRLSIGIESFNEKHLKFMNRLASYEDAKAKIKLIHDVGIDNINVDIIYALPNQSIQELKDDIEKILSLDITHISTYSLMIEKGTKIYNDQIKPIDEDKDFSMYQTIVDTLKMNGFIHYEISNFAKEGYESKHNLTYWNNENYYGFGLGASGYINNIRYDNTKNLNKYLNGSYKDYEEKLSKEDIINYELILGLRKCKGISTKEFEDKYKIELTSIENVRKLIEKKDLIYQDGYLYVHPDKLYIENEILIELI